MSDNQIVALAVIWIRLIHRRRAINEILDLVSYVFNSFPIVVNQKIVQYDIQMYIITVYM